jgi:hypothetical protein
MLTGFACTGPVTDHDAFDDDMIAAHAPLIVDTRGRFATTSGPFVAGSHAHSLPRSHSLSNAGERSDCSKRRRDRTHSADRVAVPEIARPGRCHCGHDGHLKLEHGIGGNHRARGSGGAINAVPAAVGLNFRFLLDRLKLLLCAIRAALPKAAGFRNVRTSKRSPAAPEALRLN